MTGPVTIRMVQAALAAQGFDAGPVDGVRGRRTIAALKAFQREAGLAATGLLDRSTAEALLGAEAAAAVLPDATPWMDTAARMMGLHESLDNAAVAVFLASDGGTAGDPAQVPWCADFVQTCIALSLPEEPLPVNPYASLAWAGFGIPVEPCFGGILCLWRDSPDSWKGHVGFCVEVRADHVLLRGGNQSDAICEKWIALRFLRPGGSRWPRTALPPVAVPGERRSVNLR